MSTDHCKIDNTKMTPNGCNHSLTSLHESRVAINQSVRPGLFSLENTTNLINVRHVQES